jgi:hypothetical protein
MLPGTRVVGAPIAGFYWDNAISYKGPGHIDFMPFGVDAMRSHSLTWRMRLPESCVAAFPTEPWVCALLNFSIPTIQSDMFISEMLSDNIQMKLHSGVPEFNIDTLTYITDFTRNMTAALNHQVTKKNSQTTYGKTGLFAPRCFDHTLFYHDRPYIIDPISGENVSFISAFGDWLFDRHEVSTWLIESLPFNAPLTFNPTCPEAKFIHAESPGSYGSSLKHLPSALHLWWKAATAAGIAAVILRTVYLFILKRQGCCKCAIRKESTCITVTSTELIGYGSLLESPKFESIF